jgi:DNA/RNA endonuclease YhcR with UshA esterase domain
LRGTLPFCNKDFVKLCLALLVPVLFFVATARTEDEATGDETPVIQAEDGASLESHVGKEVVVEGIVRNVGTGPDDNITFLNFGERGSGFVAVIFRAAYDKFPDGFDRYAGEKVRVRGALEKYRDRQPQIKIVTADQLEIVAPAP